MQAYWILVLKSSNESAIHTYEVIRNHWTDSKVIPIFDCSTDRTVSDAHQNLFSFFKELFGFYGNHHYEYDYISSVIWTPKKPDMVLDHLVASGDYQDKNSKKYIFCFELDIPVDMEYRYFSWPKPLLDFFDNHSFVKPLH